MINPPKKRAYQKHHKRNVTLKIEKTIKNEAPPSALTNPKISTPFYTFSRLFKTLYAFLGRGKNPKNKPKRKQHPKHKASPAIGGYKRKIATEHTISCIGLKSYMMAKSQLSSGFMNLSKVEGKNSKRKVFLYTLSTCIWCKMTKQFLKDNEIAYEYVDVDLCTEEDKQKIRQDIQAKGGILSYPTIIIDDKTVITGLQKDLLKEALQI